MKRLILILIFIQSLQLEAQTAKQLFDSASVTGASFSLKFRQDSVLSLHSAKGFFPSLVHNLGHQITFPCRMQEKHFFMLMGAAAITMTLIHYDNDIDNYFKPIKSNNPFINEVSPQVTEVGDYYGYIFLTGFGVYSIASHNYRAFRVSMMACQAAITSGIWIRVLKYLTGRMRPGESYGDPEYKNGHWFGPLGQFNSENISKRGVGGFDAFPSGHTGAAFAMATVFAESYKDIKVVPIAAYSIATIVGITRLVEHEHWASDVFVGGLIGYLCGKQVVNYEHRLFPEYKISQRKTKSFFFPFAFDGKKGIGWKLVF